MLPMLMMARKRQIFSNNKECGLFYCLSPVIMRSARIALGTVLTSKDRYNLLCHSRLEILTRNSLKQLWNIRFCTPKSCKLFLPGVSNKSIPFKNKQNSITKPVMQFSPFGLCF